MNSVKSKITELVPDAKTSFYSAKVAASTSCKELFRLIDNLMGKAKQCPLLSFYPAHQIAQVFSDYFCGKLGSIRDTLDRQAIVSQPHIVYERLFSGVPFMHFDVVSEAFALGTMIKMSPKTCDLDAIPSTLRFDCTDNVLPALTIVINVSLSSGTIPKSPKNAILKPLLNKASLDQKKIFFCFFLGGEL